MEQGVGIGVGLEERRRVCVVVEGQGATDRFIPVLFIPASVFGFYLLFLELDGFCIL